MFEGLCYHGNKSTILLFIQFLEQVLKFLVNFTLLKYVKSQRNYGFLITKELIFVFHILDLKDHFSASLTVKAVDHVKYECQVRSQYLLFAQFSL